MKFERLTNADQVQSLIEFHNRHSEFVVLDCETSSVNPREAKLIDVQMSGRNEDEAVIFGADICSVLINLRKDLTIVGHNYKYDAHVLLLHGVDLLSHKWRDTLLLGHLLDENRESYKLDSYVKEYWNDDYKEKFWASHKSYESAPEEARTAYACADIYYTGHLYRRMLSSLSSEAIPIFLIEHTHRLQSSLLRTEIEGVRVDIPYLEKLGVKLKRRIDELRPQMRGLVEDAIEDLEIEMWQKKLDGYKTDKGKAGVKRPTFSFDSSQQLQSLLYRGLGLPPQRNDKTKAISTDFASLEKIKDAHPVVGLIQEHRELQKVYTSYIEGTLERVDYGRNDEARIYPQFRVAGTVTGRLAHNSPNLAQLPKEGGIRAIYVPNRGRVLITADYSQLEVIIEANLTRDQNLIRMLENGESKHDLTARELGCDRSTAKTLNFCLQYWGSHYKVAKLLNCSIDEGKRIWSKYWEVYRGAKDLKAKTDKMVDDGTPLVTCFGRKRRFAKYDRKPWDGDYRQAYNFLIQSTGADITSRAFYLMAEYLKESNIGRALFTVHDELVIECEESEWQKVEKKMLDTMVGVGCEIGLKVPLKAESSGPCTRWED